MDQKQHHGLSMSIRELVAKRDRFQRASEAIGTVELPLLEKQALVDEILRGMPIKQVEVYEAGGKYIVTKGWAQLQAIFDFTDDKFPTWSAEEKEQWERSH